MNANTHLGLYKPANIGSSVRSLGALRLVVLIALLGLGVGCSSGLSTADYTFACTQTSQCLPGYSCLAGTCQKGSADVGDDAGVQGSDTAEPGSDTAEPGSDTAEPGSDTAEPGSDTAEPGSDTAEPGSDAAEPGSDTAEPGSDTAEPGSDTAEPGSDTAEPGSDAAEPGSDTAEPGSDTAEPGSDTAEPGSDTAEPGSDTAEPGSDTAEPGSDTAEPGSDTAEPGSDTAEPGSDTSEPGSDSTSGSDAQGPDCTTLDCDDANPCTLDQCDVTQGCIHAPTLEQLPCDWPNGCVTPSICVAGVCEPQGALLWRATTSAVGGMPSQPLPWTDAGAGVLRPTPSGALEMLRAKAGQFAEPIALPGFAGVHDVAVLTPYPDAWVIATAGNGPASDVQIRQWNSDNSSDWELTLELEGEQRVRGMVQTAGWQSWVVAFDAATGQNVVVRLDSGGNVLGSTFLGNNTASLPAVAPSRTILGVRALQVDGAVVVGSAAVSQPGGATVNVGWMARLDAAGQPLWEWLASPADGISAVHDARQEGDGLVWVGEGQLEGVSTQQGHWGRLHLNGTPVYHRQWTTAAHLALHKLAWLGDGWLAAGTSLAVAPGAAAQLWWARLTEDGLLQGSRLVTQAGEVSGVVDLGWEASVATAVLVRNATGGSMTQLQRSDLWGNASCSTWSACGNKSQADCADSWPCTLDDCTSSLGCTSAASNALCSDNNPCTDDACSGITGCVFANNTASCSDGLVCTAGDTCQAGSCIAGAAQLFANNYAGPADRVLYDVEALPDGSALAVGSTGYGAGMSAYVLQLSANGAVQTESNWNTADADFATGVAWNANSQQPLFAVGARVGDYGAPSTWMAMRGHGTLSSNTWTTIDGMSVAWDVAAVGSGAVAVGELAGAGEARTLEVVRIPGTGETGWQVSLGPCEPWSISAGETTASGGIAATATAIYVADAVPGLVEDSIQGAVARLNLDGSVVWSQQYGGSGTDRLRSLAMSADGNLYAYGDTTSLGNGSQDGWLVRINPETGAQTGQWSYDTVLGGLSQIDLAARVVHDPASTSAEGLFLIGTVLTGPVNARQLSVRRVLTGGGLHWSRLYGGAGEEEGYGLAHLPNHTHLVVGRTNTNTGPTIAALAMRIDDWGHSSCAQGGCYGQSVDFCSDGIACTADNCAPGSGQCSWAPIAPCSP